MRGRKYNLVDLNEYRDEWAHVQTYFMSEENRIQFEQRKRAIDMYIDGASLKRIHADTGIHRTSISRLIQRCIKIDTNTGKQYGYSALIPQKKLKQNSKLQTKESTQKTRGAFQALLAKYPELKDFIQDNYLGNIEITLEKRITPSNLHKKFLLECRNLKIKDYEYPFISSDKAKRTFYRYLKQLDETNIAIKRESKEVQKKFLSTGKGKRTRPYPLTPFSVVQVDGHKIDLLYTVEITNKHGETIRKPAMRLWIIAVIDVATRVILGYSISVNENYDQNDILHAIRNAIMPKETIDFTLKGLQYPDNYGFHSLMIPETEWAMPEIVMLDNAKSHLAKRVLDKLSTQIYCTLNFGSVATPESRATIERWFKTLEENGYHRLPSTTGSNTNDVRRTKAEEDSVKYEISYDDVVQLTEYFIALYNVSQHSSLSYESPLECMRRRIIDSGMQPCIANNEMKRKVCELTNIVDRRTVHGNIKRGKRPYITYEGVEYRNKVLSESAGLIEQQLIIEVNPDDISSIHAYFADGSDFGTLMATGEWGMKSHSLKTRREALRLARENKKNSEPFFAPLTDLEKELDKRAETQRRARTKAARVRAEQKRSVVKEKTESVPSVNEKKYTLGTLSTGFSSINDVDAISKKRESYTAEQIEAIIKAGSLENAHKKGLI